MKLLSDATEYALRALVWMSQQQPGQHKVREIAEGTNSPPGYLIKSLQNLTRSGILTAQRGSNGGFTMVRPPEEVTVLDVINAVDPFNRLNTCPLGSGAGNDYLCPLHHRIDDAMASIEEGFSGVSIADLLPTSANNDRSCAALRVCGGLITP